MRVKHDGFIFLLAASAQIQLGQLINDSMEANESIYAMLTFTDYDDVKTIALSSVTGDIDVFAGTIPNPSPALYDQKLSLSTGRQVT